MGIKKLQKSLPAVILCSIFVLICLNYSTKLNLWGDEAYSLQTAEKSWGQIYQNFDVHLPSYYLLLKLLTQIVKNTNEIFLRLVHSIIFAGGLFFGYKTLLHLSKSNRKALMALTLAIVSPTLIFYSTNLRMYAPLFLASMVFIWVVSKLFIKAERLTKKDWLLYFISAVTLVLIDYPGLIVFLVGSVLLSVKFLRMKEKKKLFLIFSPLLSLVVYLPILLSQAEVFLTKKSAIPTQVGGNSLTLFSLGKKIYLYFSPSFDLFSTFDKNTFLALVFPALFLIGLFLSLALVLFNRKRRFEKGLLVVILFGFYWVLFAPFAHGLTRIFLPALFFMPAFLILANQSLPSVINNLNKVLLAGFFFVNLLQVFSPTLRFYSLIPYKTIASELQQDAKKGGIKQIYLSDNSLNNLSVARYIAKINEGNLQVILRSPNKKTELPEEFLLETHLGENGNFFDPKTLKSNYELKTVKGFVKLEDLPYNSLRKKQIEEKALQDYAVIVYKAVRK